MSTASPVTPRERPWATHTERATPGLIRLNDNTYDPHWDFVDAAKAGVFNEFKRGFEDAFNGQEPTP
jgi:hypothetical protein